MSIETGNPQEVADRNADVDAIDTEMDAQQGQERQERARDPQTGRFMPRQEADEPEVVRLTVRDDPRDRIADKFNAARKEAEKGEKNPLELPEQIETGEEESRQEAAEAEEGGEQVVQAPQAKPVLGAPVPLDIVVDGRMFQVDRNDPRWSAQGMTEEQVRSTAQMYWAAQTRLAEANRVLDESRARGPAPADQSGEQSQQQPRAAGIEQTNLDPDKLGDIVDKLQFGTREEAQAALLELVGLAKPAAPALDDIDTRVQQSLAKQQNYTEIEQAIGRFEQEHADIASSKYLTQAVLDIAVDDMITEMKGVGVTDKMLEPVKDRKELVAAIYRNMRSSGQFPAFRTHEKVLLDAAGKARTMFNMPQPQPQQNQQAAQRRLEQKRQLPQQPRSAGARNEPGAPRPSTPNDAIREMRRARMPWLQ
jgi:hypothetical protein